MASSGVYPCGVDIGLGHRFPLLRSFHVSFPFLFFRVLLQEIDNSLGSVTGGYLSWIAAPSGRKLTTTGDMMWHIQHRLTLG